MTGKTHLAVGVAAALIVSDAASPLSCLSAALAGALGGVISDIDSKNASFGRYERTLRWLLILLTAMLYLVEFWMRAGVWNTVYSLLSLRQWAGLAMLALLCMLGRHTPHRSFMHSLAGGALLTGAVWTAFPEAALPFAAGFASHLLLDLLNRSPLQLFYPWKRGFCLRLFSSGKTADAVLLGTGILLSAAWLIARLPMI